MFGQHRTTPIIGIRREEHIGEIDWLFGEGEKYEKNIIILTTIVKQYIPLPTVLIKESSCSGYRIVSKHIFDTNIFGNVIHKIIQGATRYDMVCYPICYYACN